MPIDDRQFLELVLSGDRDEAVRQLLLRFRRKVFSLAFAILRDRAQAEDVTQDVFVRVWQNLANFDRRAALGTWILHIARNAAISALRTAKSRAQLGERLQNELLTQGGEAPESADIVHDAAEVARLIDTLPEQQRRVVVLFYMQERSHRDVAELLNMPVGTVKTLLYRARARLAMAVAAPEQVEA